MISFSNVGFTQETFPLDTTYNLKSVYKKIKKNYPFISYVAPRNYENVIEIKEIVYKNSKERKLYLDAYYKNNKERNPADVIIHGGGWSSGNKSQMEYFSKELASKGYSCFNIEFRLSGESQYPAAIHDVKNAIQFIKKKAREYNVDSSKVAVLGCSSGGQMAALIGTTNGNSDHEENNKQNNKISAAVNAIIDIDGILAFKHPESIEGVVAGYWLGGGYEEIPDVWEKASPLHHTDKNTPPILYINSSITRFHAGREDMIAILNKNNIYSEVKTISDSPHSFWFFNPWFDETIV
ncbi:alpha/beta hydrolase [Flavobacterium cellulosilyticum]|uniref:alpha/beta hydrolase n=1 Tax=Flavobacterium cellulosilyticum TaxID=2541731 RepID=UPI001FE4610C|nr:alpha/beta hydrolase [Flavobacterium cellulosilyticum]